jgi:peptide/nickel transport system permease protein
MVIIILWLLCALLAPAISPYGPNDVNITKRFVPPAWTEKGTMEHVLGTDEMGRDVLSRLIYGSQVSVLVGFSAVAIGMVLGVSLGLLAGYFRGWVDIAIMRGVDVMLAFPFIFLALVLMAVLGSSLANVILVLGLTGWVPYTRTIRAQVLSVREREFVTAAGTIGNTSPRIVFRHILPNVVDSAIILGTLEMGTAILSEASLTFLGLGVPPSIPTWGNMIATGREYIYTAGELTAIPGIAIFLVCLSINFVGDWVRDVRDPKLRGVAKG